MTTQTRRSPHMAGSVSKLGGKAPDDHSATEAAGGSARFRFSGKLEFLRRACCDTRLLQSDLAVLSVLIDHANKYTGIASYQSIARIVDESGVPRSTTLRAISRLGTTGWIEPNKRFGTKSSYLLTGATLGTGSGATLGTGSSGRTGAICNLRHGKTGVTLGTKPVPSVGHIQVVQEEQELQEERSQQKKNQNKKSRGSESPSSIDLPSWLPAPAWQAWMDHRGKKFSMKAQALALRKLETLRAEGHDPAKLIDLAIESDWVSFYSRESTRAAGKVIGAVERDPRTDAEIEAANEAELARFGFGAVA